MTFAIDYQLLGDLAANRLLSDALTASCSLVVFNLDEQARELLMKLTGAKPRADSFGAIYRRLNRPGAGQHLLHSHIPNYCHGSRGFVDRQDRFDKGFESSVCAELKRHFQTVEEASAGSPVGSMVPPFLEAPFSQVTTPALNVSFPVTGAQQLASTSFDLVANFYFYHSNSNPQATQNEYLVVIVITLSNMTPGGVVCYYDNQQCIDYSSNSQYTQAFSYGAIVIAAQGLGAFNDIELFPNGVGIGITSPPQSGFQQTLVDSLSSPTPVMWVQTPSGMEMSAEWTPTYSNAISQTGSPNLKWYTVAGNDDANSNIMGAIFVMPEDTWGAGNTDNPVPSTSTMTTELVNYYTFNEDLASREQQKSLPIYFFVGGIGALTEDLNVITTSSDSVTITDDITATMSVGPLTADYWEPASGYSTYFIYDVAQLSALQKM